MLFKGSCHCKAVEFEIDCPDEVEVEDCNCSICAKSGFLHLILPSNKFTLLKGSEYLETYTFNTGMAKHTFCRVCGVKPFYMPRSNPDGISINVRCLDTKPSKIHVVKFDGQEWEKHAHTLAHKSKDA